RADGQDDEGELAHHEERDCRNDGDEHDADAQTLGERVRIGAHVSAHDQHENDEPEGPQQHRLHGSYLSHSRTEYHAATAAASSPGSFSAATSARISWRAATWLMVRDTFTPGAGRSNSVRPIGNSSRKITRSVNPGVTRKPMRPPSASS